jgi:hypothetical protein
MKLLKNLKRVIGISQVLYFAGKGLQKQGLRYTAIASVFAVGYVAIKVFAIKTNLAGNGQGSGVDAFWVPVVVASLTIGTGYVLIAISKIFSSEKILIADANAMNLMEDLKKSHMEDHMATLWDRVFKYESIVRDYNPNDEQQVISENRDIITNYVKSWDENSLSYYGIEKDEPELFIKYVEQYRPLHNQIDASKESFITSGIYAIKQFLPQKVQRSRIGYDLSLVEDWYDGSYFTLDDTKIRKQFAANKDIVEIRKAIGVSIPALLKEWLYGHRDSIWFILTIKKIGSEAGNLIHKMNKKFVLKNEPLFFDAQDFLWKNDEANELLLATFEENGKEILNFLISSRKKMIRDIFSKNKTEAHNQVYRMYGDYFVSGLNLMLGYDIEFTAGLLDDSPESDLKKLDKFMCCKVYPAKKVHKKIVSAKIDLQIIDDFIEKHLPETKNNKLKLRAVRIAYYLNSFKLKTFVKTDKDKAKEIIISKVINSHRKYSSNITTLRLHYELTKIQMVSFTNIIDELGEYCLREPQAPKN